VTFLQHLRKNGSPLKACPEKQRSRNCANENTSARNSTDVWNSRLSQIPAFPAKSATFHFDFHAFPEGMAQRRRAGAETKRIR